MGVMGEGWKKLCTSDGAWKKSGCIQWEGGWMCCSHSLYNKGPFINYDVGMVASNSMSQVKHVWPSQDGYKYLALPKMSSKYLDPPPSPREQDIKHLMAEIWGNIQYHLDFRPLKWTFWWIFKWYINTTPRTVF